MSNHIGDTNKMVSETPISDSTPHNVADLGMQIRRLERQLNAANVELEEKRKDVVYLATEKAKSENYVTELENRLRALWDKYDGDRQHYMERIKRLEEAGDAIFLLAEKHAPEYWLYTQTAFNNWRKAKEDKL